MRSSQIIYQRTKKHTIGTIGDFRDTIKLTRYYRENEYKGKIFREVIYIFRRTRKLVESNWEFHCHNSPFIYTKESWDKHAKEWENSFSHIIRYNLQDSDEDSEKISGYYESNFPFFSDYKLFALSIFQRKINYLLT